MCKRCGTCPKERWLRFAIDYRKLNVITEKDTYGLPNPLTILDKLEGSRYFSFWMWHRPTGASRCKKHRKTAFHTPRGNYEMLSMPFGMVNSGAHISEDDGPDIGISRARRKLHRRYPGIFKNFRRKHSRFTADVASLEDSRTPVEGDINVTWILRRRILGSPYLARREKTMQGYIENSKCFHKSKGIFYSW